MTNQAGMVVVSVPFDLNENDLLPGCEYFLNLFVTLKTDDVLLKAGHVIAMEQFELHPQLPDAPEQFFPELTCSRTEGKTVLTGQSFRIAFDENTGRMIQYEADGKDLIVPGEGPVGSFYRAKTDNDSGFGYGLSVFNQPWKTPGDYQVEAYTVDAKQDRAVITVRGAYPDLNGTILHTVYTVYGDGTVHADVTLIPHYNESLVYVPVAGMQLTVPGAYEQMTFFGRGPEENYIDRRMGTKVGVYETTVTDNFFPYVKSSETGNRTDVRWIALRDESGFGLLAAAYGEPIEVSALHYTAGELDRRVHPYELNALSDTVLRLNAVQIGLGGDNSWSRIVPHEQYLPHDSEYHYSFALAPVQEGQDAIKAYLSIKNR